jgi:hypothetical protein
MMVPGVTSWRTASMAPVKTAATCTATRRVRATAASALAAARPALDAVERAGLGAAPAARDGRQHPHGGDDLGRAQGRRRFRLDGPVRLGGASHGAAREHLGQDGHDRERHGPRDAHEPVEGVEEKQDQERHGREGEVEGQGDGPVRHEAAHLVEVADRARGAGRPVAQRGLDGGLEAGPPEARGEPAREDGEDPARAARRGRPGTGARPRRCP